MRKDLFHDALHSAAEEYPNTILADLLVQFPIEQVVKFIIYFSGQTIKIPTVDKVWRGYRNHIIFDTLSARDTAFERKRLAKYFGISPSSISIIFSNEKNKQHSITKKTIRLSAKRVYDSGMNEMLNELKGILFKKHK